MDSTNLWIYRDGLVHVKQTVTVNETFPVIAIPLLHSSVDNFIVVDENQTVLDYELNGTDISVFTLGTKTVSIQYDTDSLTMKDAGVWTFLITNPWNLTVLLPEESTIIGLSGTPTSIDSEGNQIALTLFPDQWELNYIFPLTQPANFEISDLLITSTEAEPGEEVTISVTITNVGGKVGSYTIPLTIDQTLEATKTVTLEKGESTTAEFKVTKETLGTYNVEVDDLVDIFTISETPSNGGYQDLIPIEILVVGAILVIALLIVVFLVFRRRGPNIEKIFKINPRLNREEKNVIQFLVENDGKAFEAEIRVKFPDMPRTSLWRLVKRLEKLDIVSIKKIGLENRVQLIK
ncbi:CARDB domain-containing protein [Thermoproteota archaeon]